VEFKVENAERLTFPSNTFDGIYSQFCYHIITDHMAGFAEAFRVLMPGGRFAFAVWGRKEVQRACTYRYGLL